LKLVSPDTDCHVVLLTSVKVELLIFIKFELVALCLVLKELHNSCGSSGIVRVNDSRRMTWVGDEPQMRYARYACRTL